MRIFKNLKFSALPTISVIEPRTDVLTESFRMTGMHPAKEVSQHIGDCVKECKQRYTSASAASRPANVKQAAQSTFEFNPYELQPEK